MLTFVSGPWPKPASKSMALKPTLSQVPAFCFSHHPFTPTIYRVLCCWTFIATFQGSSGSSFMPIHSLAPKKMFFVYEIHAAPSAATDAPAAPSAPLAIFGCDCDCGVSSYTYLSCNESRWSKQTAAVTFKCVTLLPPKEAHALSVCSSSWLSLMGVEECKHKLPLSWILPPEALSISSGSSVGPYASLTLLAGVVTKASAWSPFGPLVMRVLSQQPGCSDLPRWFVKTKHRQVAFIRDCKLQHFESQTLPLLQKRSLLRAARSLGTFAHQPPRFEQVSDACSVLDGEVQRGTG